MQLVSIFFCVIKSQSVNLFTKHFHFFYFDYIWNYLLSGGFFRFFPSKKTDWGLHGFLLCQQFFSRHEKKCLVSFLVMNVFCVHSCSSIYFLVAIIPNAIEKRSNIVYLYFNTCTENFSLFDFPLFNEILNKNNIGNGGSDVIIETNIRLSSSFSSFFVNFFSFFWYSCKILTTRYYEIHVRDLSLSALLYFINQRRVRTGIKWLWIYLGLSNYWLVKCQTNESG